jgi:anti-sigma B factor antagonist
VHCHEIGVRLIVTEAGPPPFSVTVRPLEDGTVRLQARGELDIVASAALRETLSAELARGHDVLLDLEQVGFLDSSGLGTLVAASQAFAAEDRHLRVHATLSPQVYRLLVLTGVIDVLELTGTPETTEPA